MRDDEETTEPVDYHAIVRANVYLRQARVGTLLKRSNRAYVFTYDEGYVTRPQALPISKGLPLNPREHVAESLHPFFDNLILEGWLLNQAEKSLHIAKDNRFAMLMAIGRHTIGAVSIVAVNADGQELPDPVPKVWTSEQKPIALSSPFMDVCPACLNVNPGGNLHAKCARELWNTTKMVGVAMDPSDPLASFSETIHGGSISGAQRKGLFLFHRKSALLTPGAAGSTHIIKPQGDWPELPENEHVTMAIARKLRFEVPPVALFNIPLLGNIYIIKRFDRTQNGKLLKEDAAQLLGVASEGKYTGSNERVAEAIAAAAAKLDLSDFFRRLVFCYATGNGDMHLKNWAVLESRRLNGEMRLSPCYDLLNTRLAIPREAVDIGLPLRGKQRHLQASYFRKFALETMRLAPKYVESIFQELPHWWDVVCEMVPRSALSAAAKGRYLEIVEERIKILAAG